MYPGPGYYIVRNDEIGGRGSTGTKFTKVKDDLLEPRKPEPSFIKQFN